MSIFFCLPFSWIHLEIWRLKEHACQLLIRKPTQISVTVVCTEEFQSFLERWQGWKSYRAGSSEWDEGAYDLHAALTLLHSTGLGGIALPQFWNNSENVFALILSCLLWICRNFPSLMHVACSLGICGESLVSLMGCCPLHFTKSAQSISSLKTV